MPEAMRPDIGLGTSDFDRAVKAHKIMIANTFKSALTMPEVDIFCGNIATGGSRSAVDDDFFNVSHNN
jgi:hypothetical protein